MNTYKPSAEVTNLITSLRAQFPGTTDIRQLVDQKVITYKQYILLRDHYNQKEKSGGNS